RDEITGPLLQRAHDHVTRDITHLGVEHADRAQLEPLIDAGPQLLVPRRVSERQRPATAGILPVLFRAQQYSARRAEGDWIAVYHPHILVLCHDPEARQLT